jgi:hypothetical protein
LPDHGVLHPQSAPQTIVKPDKVITLKKNAARPHIHRYTLRFKTIKEKNEEEAHQLVKESLQRYLDIVLQADPKTIIPPFLELDRNDKSVSDLSAVFHLSSVDSYHVMKKYFFRLSSRDEAGNRWCSLILAQSLPFPSFMEKAKSSLENMNFSLWPKASDNENTMDVGWLLYSTRAQDEERLSALLSRITEENIGVKWKPIRSSNANIKKKDQSTVEEKIKALHVECSVDCLQEVKDKLNRWYSSSSTRFPDGTKMRLVPTISSVTSIDNRAKFASCLARQAALTAGLASAVTREISTNLLLDKKDPSTNKSFRQILMEISPENKPGSSLFHTIDCQFKSDAVVNFQFHPEHASEANNLIAGLVPFLKDSGHSYHLKMFTPESIKRQAKSKWDAEKRDNFNFTNEPTLHEEVSPKPTTDQEPVVSLHIPDFPTEHMPSMRKEDDSVSTFHQGQTINLADYPDDEEEDGEEVSSTKPDPPVGILRTSRPHDSDAVSKISISDSASRISSLETKLSAMDKAFRLEIAKLQQQAVSHALTNDDDISNQPEVANPPQVSEAGGSKGIAGHG